MKQYLALILLSLAFFSCQKENTTNPANLDYSNDGKPALIMVVDNNDRANQQIEDIAFNSYRFETISIFSEIFGVPEDSLINKDLNEILDTYGEPWQIKEITTAASSYYKKIVVLTDEAATSRNFIDSLANLNSDGFTTDVVFSLHGDEHYISFTDERYLIDKLTQEVKDKNLKIRLLYQTNCKSARAIDNWTSVGVAGCNGTQENNYLTIFAPANFVRAWVSGSNYYNAVQYAYETEISTLKSFNHKLPILDYFTSNDYLAGSTPIITGNNVSIDKNMYFNFED